MMEEMMKQCCTEDGKPNFEKMMQFAAQCGKQQSGDNKTAMMKQCCAQEGMPEIANMKQMMEKCGCKGS